MLLPLTESHLGKDIRQYRVLVRISQGGKPSVVKKECQEVYDFLWEVLPGAKVKKFALKEYVQKEKIKNHIEQA